jgi:hypothetical protein
MWKDYEPSRIADSAASALASMIGANFVYVGLPGEPGQNHESLPRE